MADPYREGSYGRMGFARTYALIFGIAYIGVAILELFFPLSDPLAAGNTVILARTTIQNLVHWVIGIAVLGSFFAGEAAARMVARIVGVVLLVVAIWGFVAPESLGDIFGFPGEEPMVYNIIHAASAALALFAGFAGGRGADRRPAAA